MTTLCAEGRYKIGLSLLLPPEEEALSAAEGSLADPAAKAATVLQEKDSSGKEKALPKGKATADSNGAFCLLNKSLGARWQRLGKGGGEQGLCWVGRVCKVSSPPFAAAAVPDQSRGSQRLKHGVPHRFSLVNLHVPPLLSSGALANGSHANGDVDVKMEDVPEV